MEESVIAHPGGDASPKAGAGVAVAAVPQVVTVQTRVPWRRLGWGGVMAASGVGIVWVAAQVRTVTVPMLVALTVAYVLDPLVDRLSARGPSRTLVIAVLLAGSLLASVGVGLLLGPVVVREAEAVPGKLQELLGQVRPWVEATFKVEVPNSIDAVLDTLQDELAGPEAGVGALARSTGSILTLVFGGTVSVLASLGGLVMIPFFVFYLLRDFKPIMRGIFALVPVPSRAAIGAHMREVDATLSAFVRGQLVLGGILAVLYAVGFSLVGLPLALVLGILTGLGNMVPFVGTGFGLVAATLMAVLNWQGWPHLLIVYGVFVVNHLLENWVIAPRVVGGSVGLSPFLVIVAVLVFGELFGFFGVLVAVPATAVLKIGLRVALAHYRASTFFTGEPRPLPPRPTPG